MGVNERLAQLILKIKKRYKVKHIHVYAPASSYYDAEVDNLYKYILDILNNSNTKCTIFMVGFNAKIRQNRGSRRRNDRGHHLIEFAGSNKLKTG